ncbi:MAG: hypothetical protein R3293_28990, partial [Candidatus Promineifilaceae bacterium]|nr:hypothetical protein [Candidatus Promineifilaceae bacterium]
MQKHRPTHFILALALSLILAVLLIACQSAPAPNPQTQAEPVEAEPVEAEETLRQAQGSEPEAEPVEAEPVEAEPEAEPAEAEAEAANRQWVTSAMTIPPADGLEIAATTTLPDAGEPVPAVLLLHMLGSNQEAWSESDLLTQLND